MPENAGFLQQKGIFCRNLQDKKALDIINYLNQNTAPVKVSAYPTPINGNKMNHKLVMGKKKPILPLYQWMS
jgi:hypothetical protein